jgi:hypothetical protein
MPTKFELGIVMEYVRFGPLQALLIDPGKYERACIAIEVLDVCDADYTTSHTISWMRQTAAALYSYVDNSRDLLL